MLNVSRETIEAYLKDGVHKTLRVVFPELNMEFTNDSIVKDSLSLSEGINSGSSIEFVGCLSSSLKIKIYNVNTKLKGKKIELYIKAGDTEEIPLFKGIVDSATIQAERAFKEIIAYDYLYTAGQKDIATWYNNLSYPASLGSIRRSLMSYIGLNYADRNLANDGIVIPEKKYSNVSSLKALTVLKSICQINGCFGIQNRSGLFEFKYLKGAYDRLFPSLETFPGLNVYTAVGSDSDLDRIGYFDFESYKSMEYEEFEVKPVEKVQIRDTEEDPGYTYGTGTNKYIIQSNIFAFDLPDSDLQTIATNIYNNIKTIIYHPCNIENIGLPFIECGDIVTYDIVKHYGDSGNYNVSTFIILSRTLKGEQLLFDTYIAEGEEEQKEFITDIQAQLDAIKRGGVDMSDYYTADEVDDIVDTAVEDIPKTDEVFDMISDQVQDLQTPTGFDIVSCYTLPGTRRPDTLYCIQGRVIMI